MLTIAPFGGTPVKLLHTQHKALPILLQDNLENSCYGARG